ncbi:legume-like lectin family-domain-containing protein [Paraphysoderma sedebokerense]|nr:legume-like lectin family-domain-containing protein [Paraphysoderma sedebokerense]
MHLPPSSTISMSISISVLAFLSLSLQSVAAYELPNLPLAKRRHDYRLSAKHPYFFPDNKTIPFWSYEGNTAPVPHYIRLASSVPGQKGTMYTQEKNKYKEWEIEFSFHIYGRNPVGGNGLAFWYTKNQVKLGNVFGANDHWNGLGLFFDTYDPTGNRNMPYIMAIVNDGSKGFNDLKGQSSSVAGACYRAVRNALDAVYVKVSYTSDEKLSVDIDFTKEGERYENCFTATNVKLPSDNYFGVSAESGEYADDHELVSFETFELNPKAKENIKARYKAHPEDFKLSDDQKKHIKDAEKKVDKIKHKEDKPSSTPYQPTVEGEVGLFLLNCSMANPPYCR